MRLKLHNIGMLEHAELRLHPLSVIAGENDNGKSTVGKIVFCIIKAINRYKEDLQESKESRLMEKADELYFALRRIVSMGEPDNRGSLMEVRVQLSALYHVNPQALAELQELASELQEACNATEEDRQNIRQHFEQIEAIMHEPEDKRRSIINAFAKVFASEFDASLLLQGTSKGSIELWESDLQLIRLEISKQDSGNLVVFLQEDPEPLELKDATFIETPLILNQHDLLIRSQTMLDTNRRTAGRIGLSYTTLHTKDLFDKLRVPALPTDLLTPDKNELTHKLQKIIDGEISYSHKQRDFVFERDDESISIKNTASGIKVFGLLQILLNNEIIGKNTMLIFDEPENHLHPKWQLKLAEFLVYLASQGIYILVSSHSPYMIEALKRYADRDGLKDQQGFFLAQNRRIEDKNQLSEIFRVLAEPFEVFRQMDAEALKDE